MRMCSPTDLYAVGRFVHTLRLHLSKGTGGARLLAGGDERPVLLEFLK